MSDTLLSCSAITAGTNGFSTGAYKLQGTKINYKWTNLTNVPDTPGKCLQQDAQTTGSYVGWTNPTLIIQGFIDELSADNSFIHLAIMKRMATNNKISSATFSDIYLIDDVVYPSGVKILITDFTFDKDAVMYDESGSHKLLPVTINARETL